MEHLAIYPYSAGEARRLDELDKWRASYKENVACAHLIEQSIRDCFDGMSLQADSFKLAVEQFSLDRVSFVLANTLQCKHYDGRFRAENKEWAQDIAVPDKLSNDGVDYRANYVVESHPAVLDGYVNQVRKHIAGFGLFGKDNIESLDKQELLGKVLVMRPSSLNENYRKPEYQLFYATGGFGCGANASGRAVYGQFLYDGEKCRFNRSDFMGTFKGELPEWAQEEVQKIEDEHSPTDKQTQSM